MTPCETTATSKAAPPPTTTAPVPTGPGICKQPSNKPCGIDLPALTCNNLAADFHAGNTLKLYAEQDSARCPSFPKHLSPAACARACAAQFEECLAVYVPGVLNKGRRRPEERESTKWTREKKEANLTYKGESEGKGGGADDLASAPGGSDDTTARYVLFLYSFFSNAALHQSLGFCAT